MRSWPFSDDELRRMYAGGRGDAVDVLDRYGWCLGAAFQIQDDALNLTRRLRPVRQGDRG